MDEEPVVCVDGDRVLAAEARKTARLYFRTGFFLLPWFWATNVWLFFPDFWHGRDPVVKKCGCAAAGAPPGRRLRVAGV